MIRLVVLYTILKSYGGLYLKGPLVLIIVRQEHQQGRPEDLFGRVYVTESREDEEELEGTPDKTEMDTELQTDLESRKSTRRLRQTIRFHQSRYGIKGSEIGTIIGIGKRTHGRMKI